MVEGIANLVGKRFELLRIVGLSQQFSRSGQDPRVVVVKCCRRQRYGRQLRAAQLSGTDVKPIAQAVRNDVVVSTVAEISNVAFHIIVMVAEQFQITCPLILLPGDEHKGASPFGRIAKAVLEDNILGGDVRHEAAVQLRIGHIIH